MAASTTAARTPEVYNRSNADVTPRGRRPASLDRD
jgi:hypothetical protein